jgi:hypothetical protein
MQELHTNAYANAEVLKMQSRIRHPIITSHNSLLSF